MSGLPVRVLCWYIQVILELQGPCFEGWGTLAFGYDSFPKEEDSNMDPKVTVTHFGKHP